RANPRLGAQTGRGVVAWFLSPDTQDKGTTELRVALGEVLGRYFVEELLEFVDDLLGVLDLVLELDRRLLDHLLGREDRRRDADREGQRVGGARVDLDLRA